jgi:hypothetical protein
MPNDRPPSAATGPVSGFKRGLDLDRPDITTVEEWQAWRQADTEFRGYPLPSCELLTDLGRPDVVKRWMAQTQVFGSTAPHESFLLSSALFVTSARSSASPKGPYEINNCERRDMTREETADVLAIAFLNSPSAGTLRIRDAVVARMQRYRDPSSETQVTYPEHWQTPANFWDAGLDYSTSEMSAAEHASLVAWYERVTGEVPGYVPLLGDIRPRLLKAYRNRFEHTLRALPGPDAPARADSLGDLSRQRPGAARRCTAGARHGGKQG